MSEGIPISHIIKNPDWLIKAREEEVQRLADKHGGVIKDPETGKIFTVDELKEDISILDYRVLEELQSGRLPEALQAAIIEELFSTANKELAKGRSKKARISKQQTERAKKPRAEQNLKQIIYMLSKEEGTAKQLWPALHGRMSEDGLDPQEKGLSYRYTNGQGQERTISLKTFENKLSEERKRKSR